MAISRSQGQQRGLFIFGWGLVGLGGWLLVRMAMMLAIGLLGQNGPAFQDATLWRLVGGAMLVVTGFTAMAYASASSEYRAVDFEAVNASRIAERESRPSTTEPLEETYGPPCPLISIRCSNCRTLNEQSHPTCIHCGNVL